MKHTARASGILLPIFSLPSRYGIGTFGRDAYAFIDLLKQAQQSYWQILPLGPISYGDSPYQSFSTYAGNPYFIDLERLIEEGLLTREACESADFGTDDQYIDYAKLYHNRYPLLRAACERSDFLRTEEYARFAEENAAWLEDYCLFMAIKGHFGDTMWIDWDEDAKRRRPETLARFRETLAAEIDFQRFLQFTFARQWEALKSYANQNGIRIIGDLPIYVAMDSADTWANPALFQFDEALNPTFVAGVPADDFSADGQLWGNPLYDWDYHRRTRYEWWIRRISHAAKRYDTVRIDHFRGFDAYWSVRYGETTAVGGKWCAGPGADLLGEIRSRVGDADIIAEDLGVQSDSLRTLLAESGYPGMKVMQFGFSGGWDSEHLPHNYKTNCVIYTGTHDNTTTLAWYHSLSEGDHAFADAYCRVAADHPVTDVVTTAMQSVAGLVIVPMQDCLELGAECRINTPSTLGGNWLWRLRSDQLGERALQHIAAITQTYFRG